MEFLRKALFYILLVLSANTSFADDRAIIDELLERKVRPSLSDFLDAFGGKLPESNPIPNSGFSGDANFVHWESSFEMQAQKAMRVIILWNHLYDNYRVFPLGRDSYRISDYFEAYWLTHDNKKAVNRVNGSTPTIKHSYDELGGVNKVLSEYMEQIGWEPSKDSNLVNVLFDNSVNGTSSQTSYLFRAMANRLKSLYPSMTPEEITERIHIANTGDPRYSPMRFINAKKRESFEANEQYLVLDVLDEKNQRYNQNVKMYDIYEISNSLMYNEDVLGWNEKFSRFVRGEDGKLLETPGKAKIPSYRQYVLWRYYEILSLFNDPNRIMDIYQKSANEMELPVEYLIFPDGKASSIGQGIAMLKFAIDSLSENRDWGEQIDETKELINRISIFQSLEAETRQELVLMLFKADLDERIQKSEDKTKTALDLLKDYDGFWGEPLVENSLESIKLMLESHSLLEQTLANYHRGNFDVFSERASIKNIESLSEYVGFDEKKHLLSQDQQLFDHYYVQILFDNLSEKTPEFLNVEKNYESLFGILKEQVSRELSYFLTDEAPAFVIEFGSDLGVKELGVAKFYENAIKDYLVSFYGLEDGDKLGEYLIVTESLESVELDKFNQGNAGRLYYLNFSNNSYDPNLLKEKLDSDQLTVRFLNMKPTRNESKGLSAYVRFTDRITSMNMEYKHVPRVLLPETYTGKYRTVADTKFSYINSRERKGSFLSENFRVNSSISYSPVNAADYLESLISSLEEKFPIENSVEDKAFISGNAARLLNINRAYADLPNFSELSVVAAEFSFQLRFDNRLRGRDVRRIFAVLLDEVKSVEEFANLLFERFSSSQSINVQRSELAEYFEKVFSSEDGIKLENNDRQKAFNEKLKQLIELKSSIVACKQSAAS